MMRKERIPGSFRLSNQREMFAPHEDPWSIAGDRRVGRIIDSIHMDLDRGGTCRVRQILTSPRELFRIELERPDMSYERTTILDREALTQLLEQLPEQTIRDCFLFS